MANFRQERDYPNLGKLVRIHLPKVPSRRPDLLKKVAQYADIKTDLAKTMFEWRKKPEIEVTSDARGRYARTFDKVRINDIFADQFEEFVGKIVPEGIAKGTRDLQKINKTPVINAKARAEIASTVAGQAEAMRLLVLAYALMESKIFHEMVHFGNGDLRGKLDSRSAEMGDQFEEDYYGVFLTAAILGLDNWIQDH